MIFSVLKHCAHCLYFIITPLQSSNIFHVKLVKVQAGHLGLRWEI